MTETFKSQQELYSYLSQPRRPMAVSKDGIVVGFDEDGSLFQTYPQGARLTLAGFVFAKFEDWRPYVEPPKSLTFDEAIKCNKLKVDLPEGYTFWSDGVFSKCDGWIIAELAFFDLAERRGWPIYEVTE